MSAIMRCSALSWENVHQMVGLTPNDLIEITAMVGKETEELAGYLENRFPGITMELATRYLDIVLAMLPEGDLPAKQDVLAFISELAGQDVAEQDIRGRTVKCFESLVDVASPEWAKRAMMAMIEFGLGNFVESLHSAGFAQNEFENSNFPKLMSGSGDRNQCIQALLVSERKKAEVLIALIGERRSAA